MTGAPMPKAAAFWEKTSAAGNRHFVGRFVGRRGGVKVLILENRDRGEGDPTHCQFIAKAAEKPRGEAREARDGAAVITSPRCYARQRPLARPGGPDPLPFDDRLDDIGVAR